MPSPLQASAEVSRTPQKKKKKTQVIYRTSQQELMFYRHPGISGFLFDVAVSIYVVQRPGGCIQRTRQLMGKTGVHMHPVQQGVAVK